MRAPYVDQVEEDLTGQAGWMYTDLMLALMVVFLATISFVPQYMGSGSDKNVSYTYSKVFDESMNALYESFSLSHIQSDIARFKSTHGLSADSDIVYAQYVGGYVAGSESPSAAIARALAFSQKLDNSAHELLANAATTLSSSTVLTKNQVIIRFTFATYSKLGNQQEKMEKLMKKHHGMAITVTIAVTTALLSFSGASADENGKNSENSKGSNSSVEEFTGSTIRSHGHPIANLTGTPTSGTSQNKNSYVNNDDANAELEWQKWNKENSKAAAAVIGSIAASPILYRSTGPLHVYTGAVQIIPVWVGTWDATRKANWNRVLGNLVTSLNSGSINTVGHVLNTNLGYFPTNAPSLTWPSATSATIPATGTIKSGIVQVSDGNVATYISTALKSKVIAAGTKPLYVYLGANNTRLSSGFGTAYCGWHSIGTLTVNTTKYVNTPYIAIQDFQSNYLSACAKQSTLSPNGDAQLDAMASVLVHEIDEALTDPDLRTWYDAKGAENADKCAWTFGTTFTNSKGGLANIVLGGVEYLIQRNWLADNKVTNADGTACLVTLP